jgi:NAD(P)-dependent dehydrogenase (short-subunit alcohol dehydrogenase family)
MMQIKYRTSTVEIGINMELKNTVVIITGGGSGLGASTAQFLGKMGAKVAIFDINKEAIEKIAKEINGFSVECDVTSEDSVKHAIEQVKEHFGPPRVCINCAGILGGERIVGKEGPMQVSHFRKVIEIDLVGTFIMMEFTLAEMMKLDPTEETGERGVVINVASIAAYEGQIGQAAYSASKGGVIGMTLPVAREMGKFGIRVVSIAPGVFETPMMQKAPEKIRKSLLDSTIFPKRFGLPEEFSKFVAHIIDNPMINGDALPLDGAIRMPPG